MVAQDEQEAGTRAGAEAQEQASSQVSEEGGAGEQVIVEEGGIEELQAALAQAQSQAAEYLDGWQRVQAEFANYRKRQEAERTQMLAYANAGLLKKLLPVVDDFDRAIEQLPTDAEHLPWAQGVLLIRKKLDAILESEGVKAIDADGQAFDPAYHEAVTYEQAEGFEEGRIIGVVQRGYTLNDRVLRPALVRVAQGSAQGDRHNNETEG